MHFRAYLLRGHMILETKNEGYTQAVHSDTCACKKKLVKIKNPNAILEEE